MVVSRLSREAGLATVLAPTFANGGVQIAMYFIYILRSLKDNGFYIGYSEDPKRRLIDHVNGHVDSTKDRRPVEMIYLEGYQKQAVALEREKNLKQFGSSYTGLLKRLGCK